jgi:hypothetical protein
MLHRARHLFIRQQTAVINSIRAYLAEFGISRPCRAQGCRATAGSRRRCSRPPAPRGRPCVSCCSRQSVAGIEGSNPGVRPTHHRLASIKRDEQTARRDPRRRAGVGNSLGRQRLRIPRLSDRDGTSRPGWGSCRSRTRAAARTSLAVSASKAIAICAACSRLARSGDDGPERALQGTRRSRGVNEITRESPA